MAHQCRENAAKMLQTAAPMDIDASSLAEFQLAG
jgi:hypothetical protein